MHKFKKLGKEYQIRQEYSKRGTGNNSGSQDISLHCYAVTKKSNLILGCINETVICQVLLFIGKALDGILFHFGHHTLRKSWTKWTLEKKTRKKINMKRLKKLGLGKGRLRRNTRRIFQYIRCYNKRTAMNFSPCLAGRQQKEFSLKFATQKV